MIMDYLNTIKIVSLMSSTDGDPNIVIGIIDGPVELDHPAMKETGSRNISPVSVNGCKVAESHACKHGTFIAGMLCAKKDSLAPSICPGCTVLVKPIFCEDSSRDKDCPEVTPEKLASAIVETINAGAKIINLSMGLSTTPLLEHQELKESFDYAFRKGVLLIAASGNQGRIGHIPLFSHSWVIPVVASDSLGNLDRGSNIGPSVGLRGIMAPGVNITSTSPDGKYTKMSGTSVAVPFVTGTAALLWSLFPKVSASDIRNAVLLHGKRRKTIVPPLLNAEASWHILKKRF